MGNALSALMIDFMEFMIIDAYHFFFLYLHVYDINIVLPYWAATDILFSNPMVKHLQSNDNSTALVLVA